MEFILIGAILIFVVTYRNSSGEGVYKFAKQQASVAYDKYAPKNISFIEFATMINDNPKLVQGIVGEFSTVNSELTKLFKKLNKNNGISEYDFRKKLRASMKKDAMNQNVDRQVKLYADIICSDDDILMDAWTFDTLNRKQRQELAIKIIDGINEQLGIDKKLKVKYIDKKIQDVQFFLLDGLATIIIKIVNQFAHENYQIRERRGTYRKSKIIVMEHSLFSGFLNVLSHEYGHFIDDKYPDLGMVGSQIAYYGSEVYSSRKSDEIYRMNPTEASSFTIGDAVEKGIVQALKDMAKAKPELYAKALQKLIDYTKVKIAAIELKYAKLFKLIERFDKKYQDIKSEVAKQMYPGYEKLSVSQFAEVVHKVNEIPKVKRAYERYLKWENKMPKEYLRLQMDLGSYEDLLAASRSDKKRFKEMLAARDM